MILRRVKNSGMVVLLAVTLGSAYGQDVPIESIESIAQQAFLKASNTQSV